MFVTPYLPNFQQHCLYQTKSRVFEVTIRFFFFFHFLFHLKNTLKYILKLVIKRANKYVVITTNSHIIYIYS